MSKKEERSMPFSEQKYVKAILLSLIIVTIVTGVLLFINALNIAASAAEAAFSDSLETQREETYQAFYQTSFDLAEEKYHVENAVAISVENVKENARLEVLQVNDIVYDHSEGNIKKWTAVKGHGIYTVDFALGEFLVDDTRRYILVRVPFPQLSMVTLDDYENYLFEDGRIVRNGSTKEGVDLAIDTLKNAQNQLRLQMASSQFYYEKAQSCTEEIIKNLVKNCNPDVANLIVEVEFTD